MNSSSKLHKWAKGNLILHLVLAGVSFVLFVPAMAFGFVVWAVTIWSILEVVATVTEAIEQVNRSNREVLAELQTQSRLQRKVRDLESENEELASIAQTALDQRDQNF